MAPGIWDTMDLTILLESCLALHFAWPFITTVSNVAREPELAARLMIEMARSLPQLLSVGHFTCKDFAKLLGCEIFNIHFLVYNHCKTSHCNLVVY